MQLLFQPRRLPRSMSRAEWYDLWRWKRVKTKELKRSLEEQVALLNLRQDMPKHIREDMLNLIVNPPLLIVPTVNRPQDIDLRPDGISYIR